MARYLQMESIAGMVLAGTELKSEEQGPRYLCNTGHS